jgi:DNA topoisomerase-2
VDHNVKELSISDFVNKELIHFAVADCKRSIPSLVDGLKPGQRKILFTCLDRNIREEIRVAQLSGCVSLHAAYHHGEESLNKAIVGMAHDFMGSNNINLLHPAGSFGSRLQGGEDAASARHVSLPSSLEQTMILDPEPYPCSASGTFTLT